MTSNDFIYNGRCPVCNTEVGLDDICENCEWQTSYVESEDTAGANDIPLKEYRKRYLKQKEEQDSNNV